MGLLEIEKSLGSLATAINDLPNATSGCPRETMTPIILTSNVHYGTTLPANLVEGQLFFLISESDE